MKHGDCYITEEAFDGGLQEREGDPWHTALGGLYSSDVLPFAMRNIFVFYGADIF